MNRALFFCLLFLGALSISSGLAGTFTDQPFFKAITGTWIGEGEFETSEGFTIQLREEWEGKANPDGTFSMKGNRKRGEDEQEYSLSFSHNPATELYECLYIQSGMEKPIRLDVSVTGERAVLTAPLGDTGGELVITYVMVGEKMEGGVIFKNSDGAELLTGKVIHTRNKKAQTKVN